MIKKLPLLCVLSLIGNPIDMDESNFEVDFCYLDHFNPDNLEELVKFDKVLDKIDENSQSPRALRDAQKAKERIIKLEENFLRQERIKEKVKVIKERIEETAERRK
eukprot:CAMPEP_0170545680 /NCGR_PEP_ID=MMETSP0211-20121228/4045_1 /TAXON_ID=311385 /ORGANISM="Pseudokeronopsis sp., Strain OXSARD2" /LENGTH=105 /DNA_ID=CAMNT_0010849707 /DNA_START=1386 /DNA_END=1703 /DNA_ORIENTATION=-